MMQTSALRAATIAVCVHGGESSWRALRRAAYLCGYGSRLSVCLVRHDSEATPDEQHTFDEVRRILLEQMITADVTPLDGDPPLALVEHVTEIEADLLVVGRTRPPANSVPLEAALLATVPCDLLVVG